MIKLLIMAVLMFMSSSVNAGLYELNVTRKDQNIYQVLGNKTIIQTRYCYEYSYSADAILDTSVGHGQLIFKESGNKCDIKAIFKEADLKQGTYEVVISRDDDNWYSIMGSDNYIKTSLCLSLALGEQAYLSVKAGGYGDISINQDECMVEGIYSKVSLK